jgi:hypothetical protein
MRGVGAGFVEEEEEGLRTSSSSAGKGSRRFNWAGGRDWKSHE